jgi:hypothetical protein
MKIISSFIVLALITIGCAQFVPPTGGPRDITPPKLLTSIPKNKSINFDDKNLELTFDEYIDITSLKQELIITPEPKAFYNVKLKDKTVKLAFEEKLDTNTTYTFNFRNGIKDLNEKNPANNLKLVLSTGPKIDSLSISGRIIDIDYKKPVLDATVGIYTLIDTILYYNRKPNYFTKSDSTGNFKFENIKNNTYKLLAFKDRNSNLIFDQKNEMVGYIPDTIKLNKNIQLDTIQLFKANLEKVKIKRPISRERLFKIQLNKDIIDAEIKFDKLQNELSFQIDKSEINLFKLNEALIDTVLATIVTTDSLLHKDTLTQKVYFMEPINSNRKKTLEAMGINTNIKNNAYVNNEIEYKLTFQYPIVRMDSSKIMFLSDTIAKDKPKFKWKSKNELHISVNSTAANQVELRIPSNTFENYKGDTNSNFSISNRIVKPDQTGSIEGSTANKTDSKIAMLINVDTQEIVNKITFVETFEFKNIIPALYTIKIIVDKNKNGIWDPGNLENQTMPEKILINSIPIKVRSNFDLKDIYIN